MGIARALIYSGQFGKPLYIFNKDGDIENGVGEDIDDSFLKEYHNKLNKIYDNFYTKEAKIIAKRSQNMTNAFLKEFIENISIDSIEPLINTYLTN